MLDAAFFQLLDKCIETAGKSICHVVIIEQFLIFGPRIGIYTHIIFYGSSAACYAEFDCCGRNRGEMMVELVGKGAD